MDGYSKYEDDNSDDGWEPESDETEEEESETWLKVVTTLIAEHASLVNFGTSTSRGAGRIICLALFVSVKMNPFVFIYYHTFFTTSTINYHFLTCTANLVRIPP